MILKNTKTPDTLVPQVPSSIPESGKSFDLPETSIKKPDLLAEIDEIERQTSEVPDISENSGLKPIHADVKAQILNAVPFKTNTSIPMGRKDMHESIISDIFGKNPDFPEEMADNFLNLTAA